MAGATHRDPTFEHAVRAEIREHGCRCCTRYVTVMKGVRACNVGKRFPACRYQIKGFDYDAGDDKTE